jgi:ribosomal protein S27E
MVDEDFVKTAVDTSLFYFVQCPQCTTVALVEEIVDGVSTKDRGEGKVEGKSFKSICPKCGRVSVVKPVGRVQLKFVKTVPDNDIAPVLKMDTRQVI